jgi:hypothetical protein
VARRSHQFLRQFQCQPQAAVFHVEIEAFCVALLHAAFPLRTGRGDGAKTGGGPDPRSPAPPPPIESHAVLTDEPIRLKARNFH